MGGIFMAWARVTTPTLTFVKYRFAVSADGRTATVYKPAGGDVMATLTDCDVTSPSRQFYRVEGTDEQGSRVVWTADESSCGCKGGVKIEDTEADRVPV